MKTVLVVDDDEVFTMLVSKIVEANNEDIECKVFNNPCDMLEYSQTHTFDIVVSDYQMPKMDGLELADRILEVKPNINYHIQSGYGDLILRKAVKEHPCYGKVKLHAKTDLSYLKDLV